ncbi:hypothetical protein Tcan_11970 [Toxocara canis]|uniref:Uncharacterized protein n=1 Tax=Toxocara canis TaxID=6265 RepID=A0A0B2UW04_TOXCA|nr:hypothetical protein Tcan_11970 [Toxocara canis]
MILRAAVLHLTSVLLVYGQPRTSTDGTNLLGTHDEQEGKKTVEKMKSLLCTFFGKTCLLAKGR